MSRSPALRQQVAAKLGRILGAPGPVSQYWSASFDPIWPDSYTEDERRMLIIAADAVIELVLPSERKK
jgi:hypothetical protein